MKPITRIFIFLLLTSGTLSAQTDTIRIMQYNLLNYGNGANPYSYKDPRLTTILQHVQPDIFGANEIANSAAHSQHLLSNVLGSGWTKGSYSNSGNQVQTNMLFWKADKFGLKSQQLIYYNLRDIIAYKLYYKDTITIPHDTVFLTVILAHLKASQGTQDAAARAQETQAVVNYLNSLGTQGNYIFMGDMNIYTSTEQAYQNLVNAVSPVAKLYDPINMPGDWNSNISFASIHTQATRTAQLPDGGVNGGLDDRFDFQLVSNYIMNEAAGMKYIPGTYKAVGQDGLHYNDALTDLPQNTSAPANVIQALYDMSDHLPVVADYRIQVNHPNSTATFNSITYTTTVVNPLVDNELSIFFDDQLKGETVTVELFSVEGRKQFSGNSVVESSHSLQSFRLKELPQGMYILRISAPNGYSYFSRVVNY